LSASNAVDTGAAGTSPPAAAAADGRQALNSLLARMVNLSEAALKADSADKAAHLIVNRIHTIVKTERAVVVPMEGRRRVLCISGDLEPSDDNPFSQAMHELRRHFRGQSEPAVVAEDTLPAELRAPQARKSLAAMGGTRGLWLPLPGPGGAVAHALWLERWNNRNWSEEEIRLIGHAAAFFGHALGADRGKAKKRGAGKRIAIMALIAFALLMAIPIHSRVSAPVQVVPNKPHYIFAPFDGIVDELAVEPGEKVAPGDLIFRYDTRVLEQRLEEALRAVAVARAELARLEGAAYADQEARARIPVQKLEVERKQAEVAFIRTQLELSEVRTDKAGVVVLDDPDALIGASLQTGQMVLSVADPNRTKLKIMVPVSDAGLVQESAPVTVRLDSDPLRTFDGQVVRIGFDVGVSPEKVPSVMVEGVWSETPPITPGQRGVARIQGPRVYLGLQLFRKPLMTLRTALGI
jgi:multidrug efflux pump subunit AcrA (membrane-fusion protein)